MSDNKLLIAALVIVGVGIAASLYYVFTSTKENPAITQSVAIPQTPPPQPTPKPTPKPEAQQPAPQTEQQTQTEEQPKEKPDF
ncbi:MAG TPA: hypothetical protein VJ998_00675, partial [Pseudomonadales bacterium]|nr:hypothetical protein [Pseudomonadales bacterium]